MFNNNPDFYPTPTRIIDKMLAGIDFKLIQTVLEPSAGKGNIVEAVNNKFKYSHSYSYNKEIKWDIDTIEKNENLQYILKGKGLWLCGGSSITANGRQYETAKRNLK